MQQEQIVVNAIIDGEKITTEKLAPRENPARPNEIVGYYPINTREEAAKAIDSAANAFPGWAKTPMKERVERMRNAVQKIKDAAPEIAKLLSTEHGKPLYDAEGEIGVSLM